MKKILFSSDLLGQFFLKNKIEYWPKDIIVYKHRVSVQFNLFVKSYISQEVISGSFIFELNVELSKNDDEVISWEIKTGAMSQVPYHPNFSIKWSITGYGYAKWMSDDEVESIEIDINNMIHALQYDRDYVTVKKRVGNEKAKKWYLEEVHETKNKFPTDDFFNNIGKIGESHERHHMKFVVGENPLVKKTFKIQKVHEYTLKNMPKPDYQCDQELGHSISLSKSDSVLYIMPAAREQIFEHIGWGLDKDENRNEQGGVLLGKVFQDVNNNNICGVVERVVEANTARGSATYLEINHETWHQMIKQVDCLLDHEMYKDLQIVGWYHTHPNRLDVFMSGTDMNTQRLHFNQDWHFAVVLNPHKQIWKTFAGAMAVECAGCFVQRDEQNVDDGNNGNEKTLNENQLDVEEGKNNLFDVLFEGSINAWKNIAALFSFERREKRSS